MKILFAIILLCSPCLAQNSTWQLPLEVNPQNTKVTFAVDTTWHVVDGKFQEISGTIELSDPNDPLSVTSKINFPVKSISTGWSMRDDSLFEHWEADKFPEAKFEVRSFENCPAEKVELEPCTAKIKGKLTIRDITKEVIFDSKISKTGKSYKAQGDYTFKWADYGIKDPSIIAAKVEPEVKVHFETIIPETIR